MNEETHEARELYIYSLNTAEPYHRFVEPAIATLRKHAKKGDYTAEKAVKLWKRVADQIAHYYAREYAHENEWNRIFSTSDRKKVAEILEKSERESVYYGLNK